MGKEERKREFKEKDDDDEKKKYKEKDTGDSVGGSQWPQAERVMLSECKERERQRQIDIRGQKQACLLHILHLSRVTGLLVIPK